MTVDEEYKQANIVLKSLNFKQTKVDETTGVEFYSFGIYSVRLKKDKNRLSCIITKKNNSMNPTLKSPDLTLFSGREAFTNTEFSYQLFNRIGFIGYVTYLNNNPKMKEKHDIYFSNTDYAN